MNKTIKVCDAICGAGKTQACIKMMNENKNKRYIFITPYLSEVERIKTSCKERKFVSPEKKYASDFSKLKALHKLLKAKRNIASTHALFSYYTEETRKLIIEGGYTLVLDEVMDIYQAADVSRFDIDILVRAGLLSINKSRYEWIDDDYRGTKFLDIKTKARSNNLYVCGDEIYFWSIPPTMFECFKDVYLLTYMFQYQIQNYFLSVNGFEYKFIGTRKTPNGDYEFCPVEQMDRRRDLRDKIHILKDNKLNAIGDDRTALSVSWFERQTEKNKSNLNKLKNNIYNFYRHICDNGTKERMWSTFKDFKAEVQGKGFANGFVSYSTRATNEYVDKKNLAYCLNVYMPTWVKNHLIELGAKNISEEMYAISYLIQWLFRSAIRVGEEVYLYLPSRRMRTIFTKWLDNLAEGKDLELIKFSDNNQTNKQDPEKKEIQLKKNLKQISKRKRELKI